MQLFFKKERDSDFFLVCERIRKVNKEYHSVTEIASMAVFMEAESYYLTTKQIVYIIQQMRCNPEYVPKRKKELYADIFKKYWEIKKLNPCFTVTRIAKLIDAEKAPRFYMTVGTAAVLYYQLLNNRPCNT